MAQKKAIPAAAARQLIDLSVTQPPVHSFNRQFARIVVDTLGADAVTLWLVRDNELILVEQIEERVGAVRDIGVSEQEQEQALRNAFEKGEMSLLRDGVDGRGTLPATLADQETLVFIPMMGLQGNVGVMRIVLAAAPEELFARLIQLAESLSGYYSLYYAQRVLSTQHEERQDIDRLSKTILQLQHYSFSSQLPEVTVNSAMEIAPLDRTVLLLPDRSGQLRVKAVSSVSTPDHKGAWARLAGELGEIILRDGEPLHFFPDVTPAEQIEDEELRRRLNSYVAMTNVTSLLIYPLKAGDRETGVLILEKLGPQRLTNFERVLCTVYAGHAASALANHRLFLSLPLSGLLARKIDKETEKTKRGPGKTARLLKWSAGAAALAAVVWLVGFYPVPEKIGASCFVQPEEVRLVTPPISGEIEEVGFDQGDHVNEGDLLLKLRTDEIELQLSKELENAANIKAQITKRSGEVEQERGTSEGSRLLADVGILQHSLAAKEHEIELLRSRLRDCSLLAPIDGIVLEPQDPGKLLGVMVQAGEPLCRIGSITQRVNVRVAVPAERVSDVREGQEVEIQLRPLITEKTLSGHIQKLSDRSVTYKNANVFMADVLVDNLVVADPDGGGTRYLLKPGMTGKAKVIRSEESSYFIIYGKVLYSKLKYWLY